MNCGDRNQSLVQPKSLGKAPERREQDMEGVQKSIQEFPSKSLAEDGMHMHRKRLHERAAAIQG